MISENALYKNKKGNNILLNGIILFVSRAILKEWLDPEVSET
jgi:hypothetical protein